MKKLADIKIYGKQATELTYESRDGRIVVHAWGVYPKSSVLAGQACKSFQDMFDTVEEAVAAYPEAVSSHPMAQPKNTFGHLPDEQDNDFFCR
ncbi:hypothetical protein [Vibrio sp. D431a]|uniref:hypothetical protein n=1 Tax=Vibrio sp. D431a TaxID=2837388 RepID=UPI00255228CC|nr:hypothetical protein [Vibrio sp. D431a]MDK9793745.1 hypothetical protein [Vibrio sp. D431a]